MRMRTKQPRSPEKYGLFGRMRQGILRATSGLGVAQRLWLIAAGFSVPIAVLLWFLVSEQNKAIEFAKKEILGAEYVSALMDVLQHTQHAQGLTVGVLSLAEGSGAHRLGMEDLASAQEQVQAATNAVLQIDARSGAVLRSSESVATLSKQLQEVMTHSVSLESTQAFDLYTVLIRDHIRELIQVIGSSSNLIHDPDDDSYYMMDAMVFRVPELSELLAQLQGLSNAIASRAEITEQEKARLAGLIALAKSSKDRLDKGLKFAVRSNPAIEGQVGQSYIHLDTAFDTFIETINLELVGAEFLTVAPEILFDDGTAAIQALFTVGEMDTRVMTDLLTQRVAGFQRARFLSLATVGVIIAATFVWLVLVVRQIIQSLHQVSEAAEQISTGDLTREVEVTTTDEFGTLARTFNTTIEQINNLLKDVRQMAEKVSFSSNEVIVDSDRMVTGVQTQNQEAVKVAKAIEGVVLSIHQVAETAAGAALAGRRALEASEKGDEAVRNSLEGMQRIRSETQSLSKKIKGLGDRSMEIYEIVSTIEEIASQTNLLALNAAIEAAGAGEAGLRFGVVADDVRKLAERSAQATKSIASLIKTVQAEIQDAVVAMERGTTEVEQDYKITLEAQENLKSIALVSRESASLAHDISRATEDQVKGAEGVAAAVQAIAKVATQTEEGVRLAQGTMRELSMLANQLTESLGRFKLAT